MAGHQRQFRMGEFTVDDVQVGTADGACLDPDQELPRPGPRLRQIGRDERPLRFGQQLHAHLFTKRVWTPDIKWADTVISEVASAPM